jgi:phosphatidylserine decarboxylase
MKQLESQVKRSNPIESRTSQPESNPNAIKVMDRKTKQVFEETVYGKAGIEFLYRNYFGVQLFERFLSKKWISKAYGILQTIPPSAKKVAPFIEKYAIPMEEFESGPFRSFNEFFIRKFKPGMRSFPSRPSEFGAVAEGRYTVFNELNLATKFAIKGTQLTLRELLNREDLECFHGGPGFIARLCPVDYHRYHFPDRGSVKESYLIQGAYHSVNPMAFHHFPKVLSQNERRVAILETEQFGKLAYVEVGALCVGKIKESHPESQPFERGGEKGYFLFGGSTVVVIGEKGKLTFDADLIENTLKGYETMIRLGEKIGTSL